MLLMIDNYDSFTYNLVQYFGELGEGMMIRRNDQITLSEIETLRPDRIVISPGPCTPKEAGISIAAIRTFGHEIPILGICLGHQAIGEAYGGEVVRAGRLMHGKTSMIEHDGRTLYKEIVSPFEAMRYHSLMIQRDSLPPDLEVTAWTHDGDVLEIMGVRHRQFPVEGMQFHPESILTSVGKTLLKNFLAR